MTIDQTGIDKLRALGYSALQASFLWLVALHSGVFLRRQYLQFAGISSGAALAGAAKVAAEIEEGTIVFIVCDGGWKYLSTGAYTADLDEAEANAEKIIYF